MYGAIAGGQGEAESSDTQKWNVNEASQGTEVEGSKCSKGKLAQMFAKDPDKMEWEDNGSILGLCIDVASTHAHNAVALIVMILGSHIAQFGRPCEIGDATGVDNIVESCICTYTQAYFDCFPYIAWAVFILGAGKDFVQKRIYYGVLKKSGVVDFTNIYPYLDPLVLLLMACYLHILAHAGVLFYFSVRKSTVEDRMNALLIAFTGHSKPAMTEDEAVKAALMPHIAAVFSILLPSTLVVVFIYSHYDIAKGVVTLSQYVHDVIAIKSTENAEKTLASLRVIKDTTMKDVVEHDADVLCGKDSDGFDFIETCGMVRVSCLKVTDVPGTPREKDDDDGLPLINLLHSLWPTQLLLNRRMVGGKAIVFRTFWLAFASFAIGTILLTLSYIAYMIAEDIMELCGHDSTCHFQPDIILCITVKVLHFCVVSLVVWSFVSSLWWSLKDFKAVSTAADIVMQRKARVD